MKTDKIESLLNAHFQNPLKRLNSEDREEISSLVHFPLMDPRKPGGFSTVGEKWAKDNSKDTLLQLSQSHREAVRIDIHSVLQTSWLFVKDKKSGLTPNEKSKLGGGIVLGGNYDRLQTVKKGGSLLTEEFENKIETLFKALDKNSPQTDQFRKLLKETAYLQTVAKKTEKEKSSLAMSL
jgi:hypothetical protein